MNKSLVDKIIALAQDDDDIRAVILEGSLASGAQVDELSDYDINIYARRYDRYLQDDAWMNRIGEVLLYQKEQFQFYDAVVPTRLILFRDRERVDVSFWSLDLLSDMVAGDKVYEPYKNGYQVLVDKDYVASKLKPPDGTGFAVLPPSRDRFLQTIYDFWFEAYCVARDLARGDLLFAKRIENSYARDHLYHMMLWHHQAARGWKPDPVLHLEGKRFERWATPKMLAALSLCFSGYDRTATWSSLAAMVDLFNRLARDLAVQLGIQYPERVERDVLDYLEYLKQRMKEEG